MGRTTRSSGHSGPDKVATAAAASAAPVAATKAKKATLQKLTVPAQKGKIAAAAKKPIVIANELTVQSKEFAAKASSKAASDDGVAVAAVQKGRGSSTATTVAINPEKPGRGNFVVRVNGTAVVELVGLQRPFGALKALDMEEVVERVGKAIENC